MMEFIEILPSCCFNWEKIKEMKMSGIKFWASDGLNQLRVVDIDERQKCFYLVNQLGKISWPMKFERLAEVHNKVHGGGTPLISYEIDKLLPTWGNYIVGLFKHLGCDKT